jgi:hypothetical protein
MKHIKTFELFTEEAIKGGLSSGMTLQDIADKHSVDIDQIQKELEAGIEVEKEHTGEEDLAKEIAMDHLTEDPSYYTQLAKIEQQ